VREKWIPIALAGGTLACVAFAATVSATPPPGVRVRATDAAPAPCTEYLIDSARRTVGGIARERAIVGNTTRAQAATDFVSAMNLIEGRNRDEYWIHRNAAHDEQLRVLARCGQSTSVDRCFGYDPPSAWNLERNSWESTTQWRSRVERSQAEATLCNVVLPEAVDPGANCSKAGVLAMRSRAADVLREIRMDQLTDSDLAVRFRMSRLARRQEDLRLVREELVSCGVESIDDPCFGFDRESVEIQVNQWKRYAAELKAHREDDRHVVELALRAERQLTLCTR